MKRKSIWFENIKNEPNNALSKDIDVDVLIIGGGITGISTAYHLKNSELKICLVERNKIGSGVTSKSTAKLTFLQDTIYQNLKKTYSLKTSKMYLESQIDAIKNVEKIIKNNNIECDYQTVSSYLFSSNKKKIKQIKKEKEILENFNIKVTEHTKLPDNTKIKYGISVENTAVFHPLKYLLALKNIINTNIDIYENTKITKIEKKDNYYICKANNNTIKAKYVILALHYPFFLRPLLMPLKCHLQKSYICAFKTNTNDLFSCINVDSKTVSIRYHKDNKNIYKIFLNGSHNIAFNNNYKNNFNNMIKNLNIKPNYIWSNKDIISNDYLPLIGLIDNNLLIGTGYNTWGMTNGSLAGQILSNIILNKETKYKALFDPLRKINIAKITSFPINIYSNMKSYIGNKINKEKTWYSKHIKIRKIDDIDIGIYKDNNKIEHIVYLKCPHLKCNLTFNEEEKTWDCPCHGSRFDIDGNCIEGPSNYNISFKRKDM